jgi:hypothetical protein
MFDPSSQFFSQVVRAIPGTSHLGLLVRRTFVLFHGDQPPVGPVRINFSLEVRVRISKCAHVNPQKVADLIT